MQTLRFEPGVRYGLAFSGGCDSACLLAEMLDAGVDVKAYLVKTAFQADFELEDARMVAESLGTDFEVVEADILSVPLAAANGPDRCYHCKTALFTKLWECARRDGHTLLLDGTNASDDAGDRPGMKALRELAVESPLRLCGLTKADVRAASKEAGLFTWDKPAYACLATRIPTGRTITREDLERVEKAEDALFALGFTDFRVRLLADAARIQLPEDQWDRAAGQRKEILAALKPWFSAVTLDLETR